jgi:hypothetical protein
LLLEFFISVLITCVGAYAAESIRPGFVTQFFPIAIVLEVGLAAGLLALCVESRQPRSRLQTPAWLAGLFGVSLVVVDGIPAAYRLLLFIAFCGAVWVSRGLRFNHGSD